MDAKALRTAIGSVLTTLAVGAAILTGAPSIALADPVGETPLYYLENPYTDESMFTVNKTERDAMSQGGWTYVKVSLLVPTESGSPVYRLYNPYTDNHLFTQDANEYRQLAEYGWRQEGVQFYSDDDLGAPMYRLYADWIDGQGSHIYSTDDSFYRSMISKGWSGDGASWYGTRTPASNAEMYQGIYYPDIDYNAQGQPEVPSESETPAVPNLPTTPGNGSVSGEGRQDVLEFARKYIGYPYVSGGSTPDEGFDCSGLTHWVYYNFGVDLPRTTRGQMQWLKDHGTWTTDLTELKPGDLIVMEYGGHVAIFVGKDPLTGHYMMIHAPNPNKNVVECELYAVYPGAWSGYSFLGGGSVL